MNQNKRIIGIAALIAVTVGTANSILRNKKLPSSRFLIGSGVAFLILSAMAETETGGELAKGLAMGIMTTVVLGEGGGLLSYIDHGEMNTQQKKSSPPPKTSTRTPGPATVTHVQNPKGQFRPDILPGFPGLTPAR